MEAYTQQALGVEANTTQRVLAKSIGVSQATLSRWIAYPHTKLGPDAAHKVDGKVAAWLAGPSATPPPPEVIAEPARNLP